MSKRSKSKKSREEIRAKRQAQREHRVETLDAEHASTVRHLVKRTAEEGVASTAEGIARFLNTKIRPEGHRFLSTTEVQKALDELVDAEEIVVVQPAERYRENHGWAERPAVYGRRDQ